MGERTDEINTGSQLTESEAELYRAGAAPALDASSSAARADDVDDENETAQIRANIEQTRAEMSETIDAIQEKISPERIKEQVKEQVSETYESAKEAVREATIGRAEKIMQNVSETIGQVAEPAVEVMGRAGVAAKDTGASIINTIRKNPLPVALIGLGVGMLIVNTRRKRLGNGRSHYRGEIEDYKYSGERRSTDRQGPSVTTRAKDTVTNAVTSARDTVTSAVTSARDTASNVAGQAREQIGTLSHKVQDSAQRAGGSLQTAYEENPLALGAVALAVGAAIGLAVPATQVESTFMGEARDQLIDKAQQTARDTVEKVQQVAEEAGRVAQREAQSRGLTA